MLSLIGTSSFAQALVIPNAPPKLHLDIPVADMMLIVQTLEQIACPNVQAMPTCDQAKALIVEIQSQAKAQGQ